jgi:hypothetical protein
MEALLDHCVLLARQQLIADRGHNILVVRHRPGIRFKIVQFPAVSGQVRWRQPEEVIAISNEKAGGVLGGPGISIVPEDEDEPENRWPEHPR